MIVHEGGFLYFQDAVGGVRGSLSIAYSPTQHRFWRIRHNTSGDTIVFETSADGQSWVAQRTIQRHLSTSALKIELSAGTWRAETNPGTAIFDNLRLAPNN